MNPVMLFYLYVIGLSLVGLIIGLFMFKKLEKLRGGE